MVDFVLGRYAGPTTFNEAKSGRLGGQSCRRNSAVVGHVLTEAITVSLAHATAPSSTGFSVLLTLQRTGRDCGAFAIQFVDEDRRHPVCSRRA